MNYGEYRLSDDVRERIAALKCRGFSFWYAKGHDELTELAMFIAHIELFPSRGSKSVLVANYSGSGETADEAVRDLLANVDADPEFESKYFDCVVSHLPEVL